MRWITAGLGGLALLLVGLDRVFPPDLARFHAVSPVLLDRSDRMLHVGTTPDGYWRLATDPGSVAPAYLTLLLRNEDRRFWWHPGVDPAALLRAAFQLATRGHIVSGGSTLAMQVVRMLEPHRHTLTGKLYDIVRALQLEAHFGHRGVLAMYLALAPTGGNIEGVRAASLIYFQHEPSALTPAQAALLVAIPQHPRDLRPDRYPARAWAAAAQKLRRVPALAMTIVPDEPILRHELPRHAWHLAMRWRQRPNVTSTLDGGVQAALEALVQAEPRWLGADADLAAIVVRNDDRSVRAYVGSAGFFRPSGMVDAVRAVRSPGSTLKPFIYAMAMDDGLILPDTLIDDRVLRIGDYAPRNFDRLLHGQVTAAEALQQSYNLPAVALLNRVGPARLAADLRAGGATLRFPAGSAPALPLALGGVGIDLADLTALYVALAENGRTGKLRLQMADQAGRGTPIMTGQSARAVFSILRGTPMPDGVAPVRRRDIAYKTGTSYGFRDAWAVGCSRDYTVGIWVGQAQGTPRPGAYGLNTAAPILFRVFDLLPPEPVAADAAIEATRVVAPALQRFGLRTAVPSLRITFPPANAQLELDPEDPIALEVTGGTPPYTWLVNGLPLPPVALGLTRSWTPDGVGFARVSVMDRDGQTVSETVRLVAP